MDNTDYCSYELAVQLKECGFDWKCNSYYYKDEWPDQTVEFYGSNFLGDHNHRSNPHVCSAPTLWEAQKWLREKHHFHIHVAPCVWSKTNVVYDAHWIWNSDHGFSCDRINGFKDYESALSAGISAALELIGKEASMPLG